MKLSDLTVRISADTSPLKQGLNDVTHSMTRMDRAFEQSFRNMGSQFNRYFTNTVKGDMKQVGGLLGSVAQTIQSSILKNFITGLKTDASKNGTGFGGLMTGIFSGSWFDRLVGGIFGGGKAAGGNIAGGNPVMVGERGPEIFVPFSGGRIIPNQGLGGGQSGAVNIHMTVVTPDARSFRASQGQILSEAALAMSRARRNL